MIKSKFAFRTLLIAAGLGGAIAFAASSASAYTLDDYYTYRQMVIDDVAAVNSFSDEIAASNQFYSDEILTCGSHGWDSQTVEECQEGFQAEWDSVNAGEEQNLSDAQAEFDTDHAQYVIIANALGMPL